MPHAITTCAKRLLPAIAATALLAFAACKKEPPHLSWKEMEGVMLDLELAEMSSTVTVRDSTLPPSMRDFDSLAYYHREVFAHHKLSPQAFKDSYEWYAVHPEEFDSVLTHVSLKLEAMGRQYNVQR